MKKIVSTLLITSAFIFSTIGLVGITASGAVAVDPKTAIQGGVTGAGGGAGGDAEFKKGLSTIVNVLLFILGAIAVIAIVIGGIRYTLSNGDQGQLKQAKDTILYAVIGLIVALLAYAIVNFVLGQF